MISTPLAFRRYYVAGRWTVTLPPPFADVAVSGSVLKTAQQGALRAYRELQFTQRDPR